MSNGMCKRSTMREGQQTNLQNALLLVTVDVTLVTRGNNISIKRHVLVIMPNCVRSVRFDALPRTTSDSFTANFTHGEQGRTERAE